MSVLDRFSSPLRSRDPNARLRAVRRFAGEDFAPLVALARNDADARVRREAIRRIEAPRVLLELAGSAREESDREFARGRAETLLIHIAGDRRDVEESRRALALLEPPIKIAEVAARAQFPEIRTEALERLIGLPEGQDERDAALARVASRAREPDARRRALDAVISEEALVVVASQKGAPEAAQAAVRRLEEPDHLLAVAHGAAGSAVRRLALRRAQERLPEDHPHRIQERSREIMTLLESASGQDAGESLRAAEALRSAGPVSVEAEELLRTHQQEIAAREENGAPARKLEFESFPIPPDRPKPPAAGEWRAVEALLVELEEGADSLRLDRIAAIEREAGRLLAERRGAGPWFERLRTACGKARDRARARKQLRVAAFEFTGLVERAKNLLRSLEGGDGSAGFLPDREIAQIEARLAASPESLRGSPEGEQTQKAIARAKELAKARRTAREQKASTGEKRIEELERRLASLETGDPFSLGDADRALRDLAAIRAEASVWKRIPPDLRARFEGQRKALLPKIREARELQEWQRWSNLGSQAEIIAVAERLLEREDLEQVEQELGKLERSWREVRKADPERGQELWKTWSGIRDRLRERVAPLREEAAAAREEKLATLEKLALAAEEIAAAEDFSRVGEMRDLAPRWRESSKDVGHRARSLLRRFRKANDLYFAAFKQARKERQASFASAIETREALIEEAAALSSKENREEVRLAVKELMTRWKESPPVPKRRSEELWSRFCEACDRARDGKEAGPKEAAGGPEITIFEESVANVSGLPATERVPAAIELWPEYCQYLREGHPKAGPTGERLLESLRSAFEEAPECFSEGRFDQNAIGERLAGIEESLDALEPDPDPLAEADGVVAMADRLSRVFAQGGTRDREADAREAAKTARELLLRAQAAGPSLTPSAAASSERIRERVSLIVARAPLPEPLPGEARSGSSGRRRRSSRNGSRVRRRT